MRSRWFAVAVLLLSAALTVTAEPAQRRSVCLTCSPLLPVFYAYETANWNEAVAKLVEENGEPDYYAIPLTTSQTGKWLLIWKDVAPGGQATHIGYGVKIFTTAMDAAVFYSSLPAGPDHTRRMMDWHDGSFIVVFQCQRGDGIGLPCD